MNRIIIGSVGHVDHGKTSVIRELTGFNGDSTPEEKKREITIELSFSSMQNNTVEISFIDVPGHEKLVKTMISGAFGFDFALLVIDANEGVKPQSLEHLLILDSIKPIKLIVVLSKSDLVSPERMEVVADEFMSLSKNYSNITVLKLFPFSIKNKSQINNLKDYLFTLKKDSVTGSKLTRLYIDRSFAISGAGCIVTGTLLGGEIIAKEQLYIPCLQKSVRVKAIQTHGKSVEKAEVGQRTAINIADISHTELKKGMLLTKKGLMRGFKEVDVAIIPHSDFEIKHTMELTIYFGTSALNCKVMILEENIDSVIATLKFDEDVFLIFGEPFVLRVSNLTIGGGFVLNPIADPIKKQQKKLLLLSLVKKDFLKAFEILVSIHRKGFGLVCCMQRFDMDFDEVLSIARKLEGVVLDEAALVVFPLVSLEYLVLELKKIYNKNRFALLSPASLSNKIVWASEHLASLAFKKLCLDDIVFYDNGLYAATNSGSIDLMQEISSSILCVLNDKSYMPPAPYNIYDQMDLDRFTGDKILKKLCSSNGAVRLAHNHFIGTNALNSVLEIIREVIKTDGFANVSNIKERLGVSRKYAINYLEYLDKFDDIENFEQKRVFKRRL